ncbi:5'-3' exonuclease [Janibacter alkaliphilus]|uniref:5'-3' exonuclease n=1 Tax=Janibacter alkaliphilus TaxID=1069963 RepID=A0A852X6R1_9MICO|nr:5'-3' exonuclease [Janibacter alkaliphilus]NYG38117.1 5'-3' exonuclease [Janibacter alkaliphilus]
MAEPRLLLLDSASLYFRAFYGVPAREPGPSGMPTNALAGFLDMIATLVTRYRPTHLAACWDDDWRPQWRVEAIPTYKSHRVAEDPAEGEEVPDELSPQVPVIAEALEVLGIARLGAAHYEADDVIGTLAHHYRGQMPIDVVTGDRDLFQLVDDASRTRVLYTARGGVREPDVVTEAFLAEKYGVPDGPAYLDMSVLRGDTSDGLPGVAGIGEKTAAKLIAAHGSLAGIREAVDSGDPAIKGAQRTRLEAATAYLDAAPLVVRVAEDVPVTDADVTIPAELPDPAGMSRIAVEHNVSGSLGRVASALYPED